MNPSPGQSALITFVIQGAYDSGSATVTSSNSSVCTIGQLTAVGPQSYTAKLNATGAGSCTVSLLYTANSLPVRIDAGIVVSITWSTGGTYTISDWA